MKSDYFSLELNYIQNDDIRKSTEVMINKMPDYFFKIEAASTGKYHPEYACGEGGLLRHTKSVVRIAVELFNIYKFDDRVKDLIIMACILHDSLKKGVIESKYTLWDHPILAANFVRNSKDELSLSDDDIEFVSSAIASHMGRFNTSTYSDIILPLPKTPEQKFVHMCDYLASRKIINIPFNKDNNIEE